MPTSARTEESIFAEALDKRSPDELAAFLDGACASDAALRARVENLLKSHEHAGSFLRKPLAATVAVYISYVSIVKGRMGMGHDSRRTADEGGIMDTWSVGR